MCQLPFLCYKYWKMVWETERHHDGILIVKNDAKSLIWHWSITQPKTGSIVSMPWELCKFCSSLINRSMLDLFCYIILLIWTDQFALQDDMQSILCQKQPKLPICKIRFLQDNAALQHTVWAKSAPNQRIRSTRKSSFFLILVPSLVWFLLLLLLSWQCYYR